MPHAFLHPQDQLPLRLSDVSLSAQWLANRCRRVMKRETVAEGASHRTRGPRSTWTANSDARAGIRSRVDLAMSGPKRMVAIGWPPGLVSGWKIVGLNLILELTRRPDRGALPLQPFNPAEFPHPRHRDLLRRASRAHDAFQRRLERFP